MSDIAKAQHLLGVPEGIEVALASYELFLQNIGLTGYTEAERAAMMFADLRIIYPNIDQASKEWMP
jgi:hypothetical protein